MKVYKKIIALLLVCSLIFAATACKKSDSEKDTDTVGSEVVDNMDDKDDKEEKKDPAPKSGEKRIINIGTWWVQYYDSSHSALEDDPTYSGTLAAQLKFDTVKKIEDKYNVEFDWKNLTYEGTKESLNVSTLAGTPDCDIYLVELSFGIPRH